MPARPIELVPPRPPLPAFGAAALAPFVALVALAGSLTLGCQPAGSSSANVVRVGWTGGPDSLNPGAGVLAKSFVLYGLVYDTLFQLELDGTFSPGAAERSVSTPDGLQWTFHLRPGLAFHDGAPLTAKDVVFSFELYKAHVDFPYLHGYTDVIESVEALDERTVAMRLSHPIANFESQLGTLYILPEHVWGPEAARAATFDNARMIGSGPFELADYRPGESIRLRANKKHPQSPPNVDEVVFVSYLTGDALVQALRTGEVDAITELPVTATERLRRDPRVEIVTGSPLTPRTWDLKLNQHDPARCPEGGVCSGHPALRDLAVRRALALATPKQELIDVLQLGLGTPGKTLIQASLGRWFHSALPPDPYDPAAARSLLDAAGYLDRDGDGVREMPAGDHGGRPLDFRFYFPSDHPATPRGAELIGRAWSKIGVRIDRRALDSNALAAARTPAFDYDVILWSWSADVDPSFLLSVMASDVLSQGANDTGWSDPEYDALYVAQARELDEAARAKMIWRMQEIAFRDVVYIVPFYPGTAQAFRKGRFTGWRTDAPMLAFEDRSTLAALVPVGTPVAAAGATP